jgi:hypothetical protein
MLFLFSFLKATAKINGKNCHKQKATAGGVTGVELVHNP